MKLIKTASKNKFIFRISRAEWEKIGIEGNWIEILATKMNYFPLREFEKRLQKIGWDLSRKGKADYMAFSPDGKTKLTIPAHNWDLRWKETRQNLVSQNRDLDFVFEAYFKIPDNFDMLTQKVEKNIIPSIQYDSIVIPIRAQLPVNITDYEVLIDNEWIKAMDIDWINYEIIDKDWEIHHIPSTNIKLRKQST